MATDDSGIPSRMRRTFGLLHVAKKKRKDTSPHFCFVSVLRNEFGDGEGKLSAPAQATVVVTASVLGYPFLLFPATP